MKPSEKSIKKNDDILENFNIKQIEINRKEAADVKSCFTTQAHQTLIASAAILGIGVNLMQSLSSNYYFLALAAFLTIVLCQTTIHVGCHKYNTANRTTAFQIHLARVIDYDENNKNGEKLALELRRIDWEEAMFAWRIVQPVIFEYFYKKNIFGFCFKRFKLPKWIISNKYKMFVDNIKKYPWYDSRELLKEHNLSKYKENKGNPDICNQNKSVIANFYPGTYLRRMLMQLYIVTLIGLILFLYSSKKILPTNFSGSINELYILSITFIVVVFSICSSLNSWWRCRILESGLLLIQTSAFVWRVVCISHLTAKLNAIIANRKANSNNQIYNGYTVQLAKIASSGLFNELHKIHRWLNKKEKYILKNLNNKQ